MEPNKYAMAGWLAILQAAIFPLSIVLGVVERGIASGVLDIRRPFFGPSDILQIIFTIIAVYGLWMFKNLLNERYQYHELDLLIMISIWWAIVFEVVGLGMGLIVMVMWPVNEVLMAVAFLVILTAALVTIGIVDILIAVKLMKFEEQFSKYIRVFAYITLAAGICEVTVLLSPIALLLTPVMWVILALVFFRDRQEVQYV